LKKTAKEVNVEPLGHGPWKFYDQLFLTKEKKKKVLIARDIMYLGRLEHCKKVVNELHFSLKRMSKSYNIGNSFTKYNYKSTIWYVFCL
jgi:hypothetical protein